MVHGATYFTVPPSSEHALPLRVAGLEGEEVLNWSKLIHGAWGVLSE